MFHLLIIVHLLSDLIYFHGLAGMKSRQKRGIKVEKIAKEVFRFAECFTSGPKRPIKKRYKTQRNDSELIGSINIHNLMNKTQILL